MSWFRNPTLTMSDIIAVIETKVKGENWRSDLNEVFATLQAVWAPSSFMPNPNPNPNPTANG